MRKYQARHNQIISTRGVLYQPDLVTALHTAWYEENMGLCKDKFLPKRFFHCYKPKTFTQAYHLFTESHCIQWWFQCLSINMPTRLVVPLPQLFYLIYFVRKRRWKSLRMVSLTNRFLVSGSVLAWPLKTTSSFHLPRIWVLIWRLGCKIQIYPTSHFFRYVCHKIYNFSSWNKKQRWEKTFAVT